MHIYPLFHIALPLLVFEIPQIKNKHKINRFALILSSLLPDLIDKPLMFLNLGSGRGYSHTLLFTLIGVLTIFLFSKRNKSISILFLIGFISHLLLDLPDVPFFYPFVSYDFIMPKDPFWEWVKTLLTDPWVISTEAIGIVILIFVTINNKLFSIIKIVSYLGISSQSSIKEN